MKPSLNVVSLPGFIKEMVGQGFKPGSVQFVNSNFNSQAGDLVSGKTAFVNGALVTGTVTAGSNVTGGSGLLSFSLPDGLYNGKTATASELNLISGNIKSGATIFGVAGSTNVLDTTEGTSPAAAATILLSKKAFVNGASVTGSMPNNGGMTIYGLAPLPP